MRRLKTHAMQHTENGRQSRRNHDASKRLEIECLEPRMLLAVSPAGSYADAPFFTAGDACELYDSADHLVTIDGSDLPDQVTISETANGMIEVEVKCGNGETLISSWAAEAVAKIRFIGRDGDDRFENLTSKPAEAYGDAGHDSLTGGTGYDELHGGSENDVLRAYPFLDIPIVGPCPVGDELHGDAGDDELYGSCGPDELDGGADDDEIRGYGGDDQLGGGGGNDTVLGGAGHDNISGGFGDDVLYGGLGNDSIDGGAGFDKCYGDEGNDRLAGGYDNVKDELYGSPVGRLANHSRTIYLEQDTFVSYWKPNSSGGLTLAEMDLYKDKNALDVEEKVDSGLTHYQKKVVVIDLGNLNISGEAVVEEKL